MRLTIKLVLLIFLGYIFRYAGTINVFELALKNSPSIVYLQKLLQSVAVQELCFFSLAYL